MTGLSRVNCCIGSAQCAISLGFFFFCILLWNFYINRGLKIIEFSFFPNPITKKKKKKKKNGQKGVIAFAVHTPFNRQDPG